MRRHSGTWALALVASLGVACDDSPAPDLHPASPTDASVVIRLDAGFLADASETTPDARVDAGESDAGGADAEPMPTSLVVRVAPVGAVGESRGSNLRLRATFTMGGESAGPGYRLRIMLPPGP